MLPITDEFRKEYDEAYNVRQLGVSRILWLVLT